MILVLFFLRIDAFSNRDPPVRHFLNAVMEERADSNTSGGQTNNTRVSDKSAAIM